MVVSSSESRKNCWGHGFNRADHLAETNGLSPEGSFLELRLGSFWCRARHGLRPNSERSSSSNWQKIPHWSI